MLPASCAGPRGLPKMTAPTTAPDQLVVLLHDIFERGPDARCEPGGRCRSPLEGLPCQEGVETWPGDLPVVAGHGLLFFWAFPCEFRALARDVQTIVRYSTTTCETQTSTSLDASRRVSSNTQASRLRTTR